MKLSRRMQMGLLFACCAIAVITGLIRGSEEKVSRSQKPIVTDAAVRLIRETLAGSDTATRLSTERDVYMLVRVAGPAMSVRLVAKSSVDPERLARALESAVAGTRLDGGHIRWSQERGFTAVRVGVVRVRPFRRTVCESIPIGEMAGRLEAQGLQPHILLSASGSTPDGYRLIRLGTRTVRPQLAIFEVPATEYWAAMALVWCIPLVWFLFFIASDTVTRIPALCSVARGVMLATPLHWILAYLAIRLHLLPAVADLWFAQKPLGAVYLTVTMDIGGAFAGVFAGLAASLIFHKGPAVDPEDEYENDELDDDACDGEPARP